MNFHEQVFDLFAPRCLRSYTSIRLREQCERLRSKMLETVRHERDERQKRQKRQRDQSKESRKVQQLSARISRLRKLVNKELVERKKMTRKQFGATTLPEGIHRAKLEEDQFLQARLPCDPEPIYGPFRSTILDATADFQRLKKCLEDSGPRAAAKLAADLDVQVMTAMFLRGQGKRSSE
eukprot:TRINITY_DN13924_c0_g1_i2.p1 TRINITY_DN13924_c0_g1~~TRINITY_DN13924_c0_g1_i2.p1  ORF type:complete len:187 (-),score=34.08 TRINITY_DN13924_c0_g1_i2:319-858(-)